MVSRRRIAVCVVAPLVLPVALGITLVRYFHNSDEVCERIAASVVEAIEAGMVSGGYIECDEDHT